MTSRERILSAIEHRQTDKLPVDFGGSVVTGISASMIYKLRKAYKLPEHPVKVVDCFQMLGEVEDDLREKLGGDCVLLTPYANHFGIKNAGWKPWTLFDNTPVLVPAGFNTTSAPDGGLYQYPQGDQSLSPSGLMPKGGYYFDVIERETPPFDEDNPSVEDNLEEFSIISDEVLQYYKREAESLRKNTDCAIATSIAGTALGNVSIIPGPSLKHPRGIRSITEWYMCFASRQDFLKELFDRQTQISLKNLALLKEAVGDTIDVLFLCGADFGIQSGPFLSIKTFNEVLLPYYRRMTEWIHRNTSWKIAKHCCGSIKPLIPKFIEAGFDILNPIQNSAADMDPQELKNDFGDNITFSGGGVDTQHTLPFGSPDEVYKQVTERINIYFKNGGFIFSTIHNTQSGVPVENFMAMIEAIKQFR